MNTGWICPRCGKVNAPYVKSCDCKSEGWDKPIQPTCPIPWCPPPTYPQPIWIYREWEQPYKITCSSNTEYIKGE